MSSVLDDWMFGCLLGNPPVAHIPIISGCIRIGIDVLGTRRSGQMYQDYLGTCALLGAGD